MMSFPLTLQTPPIFHTIDQNDSHGCPSSERSSNQSDLKVTKMLTAAAVATFEVGTNRFKGYKFASEISSDQLPLRPFKDFCDLSGSMKINKNAYGILIDPRLPIPTSDEKLSHYVFSVMELTEFKKKFKLIDGFSKALIEKINSHQIVQFCEDENQSRAIKFSKQVMRDEDFNLSTIGLCNFTKESEHNDSVPRGVPTNFSVCKYDAKLIPMDQSEYEIFLDKFTESLD